MGLTPRNSAIPSHASAVIQKYLGISEPPHWSRAPLKAYNGRKRRQLPPHSIQRIEPCDPTIPMSSLREPMSSLSEPRAARRGRSESQGCGSFWVLTDEGGNRASLAGLAGLLLDEERHEQIQVDRVACRCRVNGGLA